jgi:hypothetical protein
MGGKSGISPGDLKSWCLTHFSTKKISTALSFIHGNRLYGPNFEMELIDD